MATNTKTRARSPKSIVAKLRRVIANLSGESRIERLHGREHLVLPVKMIVPGVLNGSNGPLLYPPSEVGKDPHDWNGMPIVVRHPTDSKGNPVSARSASVLNKSGIGIVLESKFGKALEAEAWFDIEKTIKVNSRLYERLAAGEPVELSTGLWTINEPRKGTYKNKPYTHIARNYKPDHLAILPDEKGACSVKDGCGVNVRNRNKKRTPSRNKSNSSVRGVSQMRKLRPEVKKRYIDNLIGNCDCAKKEKAISKGPWTAADRAVLNKMPDDKLVLMEKQRIEAVNNAKVAAVATKGFVDGEATFAFNSEKGTFEKKVKRTKKVATTNRSRKPDPVEEEVEPVANSSTKKRKRMTENEFLALMPASMKEDLTYARNKKKAEKAALIKVITANKNNVFKPDFLEAKDLAELTAMAALAGPVENSASKKSDNRFTRQPKLGNYAGAAGSHGQDDFVENENDEFEDDEQLEDDEPLGIPTLNYEEMSEGNQVT